MTRTALVTGGVSGLGAASAQRLREDGLTVVTLDRAAGADVVVDLTDEAALDAALADIGPVDVLVNSAGINGPSTPLVQTTADEWRQVFEVNVLGTVATMRLLVPGMVERGWGRVVNFASMAGKDGNPGLAPYSASKAAVIALTVQYAKSLPEFRVNASDPGYTATEFNGYSGHQTVSEGTDATVMLATIGPDGPTGEFHSRAGRIDY